MLLLAVARALAAARALLCQWSTLALPGGRWPEPRHGGVDDLPASYRNQSLRITRLRRQIYSPTDGCYLGTMVYYGRYSSTYSSTRVPIIQVRGLDQRHRYFCDLCCFLPVYSTGILCPPTPEPFESGMLAPHSHHTRCCSSRGTASHDATPKIAVQRALLRELPQRSRSVCPVALPWLPGRAVLGLGLS